VTAPIRAVGSTPVREQHRRRRVQHQVEAHVAAVKRHDERRGSDGEHDHHPDPGSARAEKEQGTCDLDGAEPEAGSVAPW